jgi:L-alanine-DL-glutamate epimerase-like enolase superfamily enzyme
MTHRPALVVCLRDEDGFEGWGECFSNWPSFAAEHRYRIISEIMYPLLVGQCAGSPAKLTKYLKAKTQILRIQSDERGPFDQAVSAIDIAAWDLASRRANIPLYVMLGGNTSSGKVPVYASGLAPGTATEVATKSYSQGIRAFKLKVGFGLDSDILEISKIRNIIGSSSRLMVDANQSWTMAEAKAAMSAFKDFDLTWIEEPIPADSNLDDFAKLASASTIPISAGENVRGVDNFSDLMTRGGIAVIQPDVIKWGGLTGCHTVALEALNRGLRFCPHYLGGGIGLLATAHLLAAVGGDGILELDATDNPLRELLAQPFPTMKEGYFHLSSEPGLGVIPDLNTLEPYLVSFSTKA